jgi:hypothetical protein
MMTTGRPLHALVMFFCLACIEQRGAMGVKAATEPGPAIGSPAPAFTLPDQAGQPRTLDSLKGPRGTVLAFFRSADW